MDIPKVGNLIRWAIRTFSSSIGKKFVMAITGLTFCMFLLMHLVGNFTLYGGAEMFDGYAERLKSLGPMVKSAELCLFVFVCLHITFGVILFYQNQGARPTGYVRKKNAGGRTLSSWIMPYTGLYLAVFVVLHLLMFVFAESATGSLYQLVSDTFSMPAFVLFYILSVVVAALHVRHGLWSAFQTIGADHPKYMPIIKAASILFSLMVGLGFASIPLFFLAGR